MNGVMKRPLEAESMATTNGSFGAGEVSGLSQAKRTKSAHEPALTNGSPASTRPSATPGLSHLYSNPTTAKIWGVAERALKKDSPPRFFPEYTKPGGTEYVYRELDFWTSGFFPGSLYLLLERSRRFSCSSDDSAHELQLEFACRWWTENLHQNAHLTNTHDLGFMIHPWAKLAWELNRDERAFQTMCTAANSLAARYSPVVSCIRSWDICVTKKYLFDDTSKDFLMIIDNMMNLDLLFYVASATGNKAMHDIAVNHARVTQREHVRPDFSTTHLVVFDPATGAAKQRLTNQGFAHESCWSRGQAWAIAGFAQTYRWSRDRSFLDTARSCADYLLARLPESGIPPWDFDAAARGEAAAQPPDTSAAIIAAYGMLLIHQALLALGEPSEYLSSALRIVAAIGSRHVNAGAKFVTRSIEVETVEHGRTQDSVLEVDLGGEEETILNGATINNYEFAPRRWANHGLVYADYFYLLVGNKLLEMGIGDLIREEGNKE